MDRRSRRNALDRGFEAELIDVIDAMNHYQEAISDLMRHGSEAKKVLGVTNLKRLKKACDEFAKVQSSATFRKLRVVG
jgi:hypothetical protein